MFFSNTFKQFISNLIKFLYNFVIFDINTLPTWCETFQMSLYEKKKSFVSKWRCVLSVVVICRCLKSSIRLSAKIMKEESNSRFIIKLVLILPWTKSVCFRGCTLEWQVLIIKLSNIGNDTEQWINYFIVSLSSVDIQRLEQKKFFTDDMPQTDDERN